MKVMMDLVSMGWFFKDRYLEATIQLMIMNQQH